MRSTDQASKTVAKTLQASRDTVSLEVAKLEKILHGPPAVSDAKALAICMGLQRHTDKDRRERALACVKNGDEAVAAVILNSSELATGLAGPELAEIRSTRQHSRHPEETRRLVALKDALQHIDVAGQVFNGFWPKLYSRAVVEDAEKRATKANAMLGAA